MGANAFVFNNIKYFIQYKQIEHKIYAFEGSKCKAEGLGVVIIRIPDSNMIIPCWSAYYCPQAPHNIIGLSAIKSHLRFRSVRQEVLSWLRFVDHNGHSVRVDTDQNKHREVLLNFFSIEIINITDNASTYVNAMINKTPLDWSCIHCCLNHPSDSHLARMCRSAKFPGLPKVFPTSEYFQHKCRICAKAKMRKTSAGPVVDTSTLEPGQMFHADFTFYNIKSIRGFTSSLTIIDAKTRRVWVFCTPNKRPPIDIMCFFLIQNKH